MAKFIFKTQRQLIVHADDEKEAIDKVQAEMDVEETIVDVVVEEE